MRHAVTIDQVGEIRGVPCRRENQRRCCRESHHRTTKSIHAAERRKQKKTATWIQTILPRGIRSVTRNVALAMHDEFRRLRRARSRKDDAGALQSTIEVMQRQPGEQTGVGHRRFAGDQQLRGASVFRIEDNRFQLAKCLGGALAKNAREIDVLVVWPVNQATCLRIGRAGRQPPRCGSGC